MDLILRHATRIFTLFILFLIPFICLGQTATDTLTKKEFRQHKKQVKIDQGKMLFTPLAGPAYTPEMGFTVAGGFMLSYKTNPKDSLIQRSSSPIMFGASVSGAVFLSTIASTYWFEDKLRIYADI